MRKALQDSFIWRGIYFITILLLNIGIVRVYEASESGWIFFISNNFYLVLLMGSLSLDSSITYFSASNQVALNKLALFSLVWPLVVSLISFICTGIFIYNGIIKEDYVFLLLAGAAYTLGISLTNFFTALFYSRHQFALPNIFMSAINLFTFMLIFIFSKSNWGLNRDQFLYIYFLQFVIQGVGLALIYIKRNDLLGQLVFPDKYELRKIFRFALIALSANVAYYLIYRIDYLFVEAFCSPKALGNYVQASKMGQFLLIIPTIIAGTVYPQSAKENNPSLISFILQIISVLSILYLIIFSLSYFFSNSVFIFLFGSTFNEMYLPFLLLLPGILFLSIHTVIAAYFGGKNKPSYNVLSTGIGLLVVIVGDVFFIQPYGICGAAIVSSVGYMVASFISLVLFINLTKSSITSIINKQTFKWSTYKSFFQSSTK